MVGPYDSLHTASGSRAKQHRPPQHFVSVWIGWSVAMSVSPTGGAGLRGCAGAGAMPGRRAGSLSCLGAAATRASLPAPRIRPCLLPVLTLSLHCLASAGGRPGSSTMTCYDLLFYKGALATPVYNVVLALFPFLFVRSVDGAFRLSHSPSLFPQCW